jgi:hypothetical protein
MSVSCVGKDIESRMPCLPAICVVLAPGHHKQRLYMALVDVSLPDSTMIAKRGPTLFEFRCVSLKKSREKTVRGNRLIGTGEKCCTADEGPEEENRVTHRIKIGADV